MPLSPSQKNRTRVHSRRVHYEGFIRGDGLYDIEARLSDVRDRDTALLSGVRPAGEPVHDFSVRVTIDTAFIVHDIETSTDAMPYPGACGRITGAYRKLIGASLVDGFRKKLQQTMGDVAGCTHLTEMLANVPSVAIQTFAGLRREDDTEGTKPFQLDRCHALDTSGEMVRRYYPTWYRKAV